MQFKQTALSLLFFVLPAVLFAQSTLLPQGNKYQQFLDRMEIKSLLTPVFYSLSDKPYSRQVVTNYMSALDSVYNKDIHSGNALLSTVDFYNIHNFRMNNTEWVTGDKSSFNSRKSLWNTFYKTKPNFVEVNEKDFFLAINPVIQQTQSVESNNSSQRIFLNSKGLTFRGLIANKIGFDFYATDNQERPPLFVQAWQRQFHAVPGAGYYKPFKTTAYDYLDARGSVFFNATKYINFQFGYDKNFIGNGYRSMFLSDFGANYLFLKINTRIWKINYQNLFMELTSRYLPNDVLNPKKYAAMHHLDLQVARWLNLGLFEAVIFGRENRFDFSYLNPIILLRSVEQQNGSPDNAFLGFDFKANVAHTAQLYGQVLFDEFVLKEMKAGNGWWGNKFGIQAGAKYIDAFHIKNFDLQGEINLARPFTYSHSDSVANYSHYDQPLAHPLGANFAEAIGIIRCQPKACWYMEAKLIVFRQGYDISARSFGSNIFKPYTYRVGDYGYKIGSGARGTGVNASLWIGYEVLENLFIDGSVMYRKLSVPTASQLSSKTTLFTLGLRLNMGRRQYDY